MSDSTAVLNSEYSLPQNAIAVVGMAGRFPGANSVSDFWRNLRRGEESIVDLSEDDLVGAGVSERALGSPSYVRRAALMSGIDEFDAEFFGFTPQSARMLDPQHRLFLQAAFHALEDAGYEPGSIEESVGVFGTSSASGYLLHNLMSHHHPSVIIGEGATFDMVSLSLQNDKDHLATRVAHQFDLRGPALAVQTACSSSLVAVHLACQSILNGECEMALAGGASVRVPHNVGYWHEPGSMVSATGHCRPFDVRADGTIFGSGVGVIVLKPLEAAVDADDRIHAVIRGSAINNDGATKMNYAAPNAVGQADVIAEAHAIADIDASTVTYVETHGTGTPLGDPIEVDGLRKAFAVSEIDRSAPCYIGSVKSNIGHLEVASGIAGLIKTIMCLKYRAIPATLHYTGPNPELHLDDGPFAVRSHDGVWESDGIRRAGVSSFGVGGTNAHVVLEEAPPTAGAARERGPQVLLMSARTEEALQEGRDALAAELTAADEMNLADVSYTLARRHKDRIRLVAVVNDREHAATVLHTPDHDNAFVGEAPQSTRAGKDRIAFVFPGQGAQHIGMARGLHDAEPVFAEHFRMCTDAFADELGIDLRREVFEGVGRDLERTDRAQPALFAVEYALAKLVESYGITPAALAGHSIGEYAAATIAGVFDLPTAVKVVSMRARLMHASPRGVMVAVPLPPDAIAEYLTDDVDLATVNDPGNCVVAGTDTSIATFQGRLAQAGIVARRVRTSHAFHSRLMDSVVPEFHAFLSRMTLREPRIPLLSNISGRPMSAGEATDPATWARQIRATVRFSDELDVLLGTPDRVLVEVGPGGPLTSSAMRHPRWSSGHRAVRLMRHQAQNKDDRDVFLLALGQLWSAGLGVDWTPLASGQPKLISLPGYPFVRERHWVEYNPAVRESGGAASNGSVVTATGTRGKPVVTATSQMETTLQRIWSQCLGVGSIDRNANFFEIGGDSLVAISVAMGAANEGLDLTPQDLYENPTLAALATTLATRYADGGLARQTAEAQRPPVPPNISHFLQHGSRDVGRWRIPVILRLSPDVDEEDVRSVLTAVTNHHDVLRLEIVERAGVLEQHFGETGEFEELAVRSLPPDAAKRSSQESDELSTIVGEQTGENQSLGAPLTATFIRGEAGSPGYLALRLHGIASDDTSREILLTDIFTGFEQRAAGREIELQPATTSWREWSQRCASLATHPAVLESRDYWLETASRATLSVVGPETDEPPCTDDLVRLSSSLTVAETAEIDEVIRRLRLSVEDLLLGALCRTVAARVGEGAVAVDICGPGRSVLKPDVDTRRSVGWFTTVYPVVLRCATSETSSGQKVLDDVRDVRRAVPHYGMGYGLLRYNYAPTARLLAAARRADIFLTYAGAIPDVTSDQPGVRPVEFHTDMVSTVRDVPPGLGHALEVRAYRSRGALHVDWWYDTRRVDSADAEALSREFGEALRSLGREALAEDADSAGEEMGLVELS